MRRVQKAAAVLAALALTTALAVPVWAADTSPKNITTAGEKAEISVTGTYNLEKKYNVDIAWTAMNDFTYTAGEWQATDDSNLKYNETTGWNNNTENTTTPKHKITVVNRSNANIDVEFSFEATGEANKKRLAGRFVDVATATGATTQDCTQVKKIWMQRADANVTGTTSGTDGGQQDGDNVTGVKGSPVKAAVYFSLVGRPADRIDSDIGTITVTVSAIDSEENSLAIPSLAGSGDTTEFTAAYSQSGVYVARKDSGKTATEVTDQHMQIN